MKSNLGKLSGGLCLAAVLVALPAHAALNMFLDIPGVTGESTDPVHTNQMDVLSWSWGMSNSGSTVGGGGGVAGKASIQDVSFTKYVDKASPLLMLHCANGAHLTTATLYVLKAGGTPNDYIKIIMTEVMVTSVSTGGSGGEDRLTENVTLNFAKVEFDYSVITNGKAGVPNPFRWDIGADAPY